MGHLSDENKLEVNEKNNKNWQLWKMYIIINFTNIRFKLTASGNFIHLVLKYSFKRPVNILR